MYEHSYPEKRFQRTLNFLQQVVPPPCEVLDLGVSNPLSDLMRKQGYQVTNTQGEDLDFDRRSIQSSPAQLTTAFEIFEHMLNPLEALRAMNSTKLVASVPLKLWFAPAYKSKTDPWDRHYHEFEAWQFDWLLEKSGWQIKAREQWTHPVRKVGIRPLLRLFIPRYYIVYAER